MSQQTVPVAPMGATPNPLILDKRSTDLIDDLWTTLELFSVNEEPAFSEALSALESAGWAVALGDSEAWSEFGKSVLQNKLSIRGASDDMVSRVEHILTLAGENLKHHGSNRGAMLYRFDDSRGALEIVFLDVGKGFVDVSGNPAPLHEAIKEGRQFGSNGKMGIGLTSQVVNSDDAEITSYSTSRDTHQAPIGFIWRTGDFSESRLSGTPIVNHGTKFVSFIRLPISAQQQGSHPSGDSNASTGTGQPGLSQQTAPVAPMGVTPEQRAQLLAAA